MPTFACYRGVAAALRLAEVGGAEVTDGAGRRWLCFEGGEAPDAADLGSEVLGMAGRGLGRSGSEAALVTCDGPDELPARLTQVGMFPTPLRCLWQARPAQPCRNALRRLSARLIAYPVLIAAVIVMKLLVACRVLDGSRPPPAPLAGLILFAGKLWRGVP
jgi:hypothetical protein